MRYRRRIAGDPPFLTRRWRRRRSHSRVSMSAPAPATICAGRENHPAVRWTASLELHPGRSSSGSAASATRSAMGSGSNSRAICARRLNKVTGARRCLASASGNSRPMAPWPTCCSTWISESPGFIRMSAAARATRGPTCSRQRSPRAAIPVLSTTTRHAGRLRLPGDRRAVVPDAEGSGAFAHHRIPLHRQTGDKKFAGTATPACQRGARHLSRSSTSTITASCLACATRSMWLPPTPVAAAAAAPAPAAARSYLVFFDWDKATLTDRARQIVKEAAETRRACSTRGSR